MDTQIQDIQKLIDEKKFEEAAALIKAATHEQLSGKQKGELYAGLASVYMKLTNAVNAGYRDALQEAIESAKKLQKVEVGVKEKISLAEVREKLNS